MKLRKTYTKKIKKKDIGCTPGEKDKKISYELTRSGREERRAG